MFVGQCMCPSSWCLQRALHTSTVTVTVILVLAMNAVIFTMIPALACSQVISGEVSVGHVNVLTFCTQEEAVL